MKRNILREASDQRAQWIARNKWVLNAHIDVDILWLIDTWRDSGSVSAEHRAALRAVHGYDGTQRDAHRAALRARHASQAASRLRTRKGQPLAMVAPIRQGRERHAAGHAATRPRTGPSDGDPAPGTSRPPPSIIVRLPPPDAAAVARLARLLVERATAEVLAGEADLIIDPEVPACDLPPPQQNSDAPPVAPESAPRRR